MSERKIDLLGASSIVVANMIGTGVFTSLGFQLFSVQTGFGILAIWLIGGILAFLGALCYAEIATRLPEDGGEYHFLSKIYHPSLGFMAGFVSSTVGFAAPIAGAAIALGAYLKGIFNTVDEKLIAAIIIILISVVHSINISAGMKFQKIFTIIKVCIVIVLIFLGIYNGNMQHVSFNPTPKAWTEILSIGFATSLVWVSFAYSGWNASAYIAGEIKNPEKNLSRSILYGAGIVTILYVLVNMVFMMAAPVKEMTGVKEVGFVASKYIFGESGGKIIGGIIATLLISTISSMIFAGPRVIQPMFNTIPGLKIFGVTNKDGNPIRAIIFQTTLSLILLYTVNFEKLIFFIAFTLSLFTLLTVIGLFVLRVKKGKPQGYKALGYPITPILFISMTAFTCVFFMIEHTKESVWGIGIAVLGLLLYFISDTHNKQKQNSKN